MGGERPEQAGRDGTRWESQAHSSNLVPGSLPTGRTDAPRHEPAAGPRWAASFMCLPSSRGRTTEWSGTFGCQHGERPFTFIDYVNQPCFLGGSVLTTPTHDSQALPVARLLRAAPSGSPIVCLPFSVGGSHEHTEERIAPSEKDRETPCPPAPSKDGPISPLAS